MTFEAGINTLGGSAIFIDQKGSRLGERETLADVAHNLERWIDVIVLRTFQPRHHHGDGAVCTSVPVVNALSDIEHPCQALADDIHVGRALRRSARPAPGLRWRRQQCCQLAAADIGADGSEHHGWRRPRAISPKPEFLAAAKTLAANAADIPTRDGHLRQRFDRSVSGADAIYTDQWGPSMGQRKAKTDCGSRSSPSYQVNQPDDVCWQHRTLCSCTVCRRAAATKSPMK